MEGALTPESAEAVREAVAGALAEESPLEVLGAGSKRDYGRPSEAARKLNLSALSGVALYEPEELVMTAGVGTRLSEIEARLTQYGQFLAFEPADYGPLLGGTAGQATIGGVLACNLSGPRRIAAGAARDHFLGVEAVSGRGEAFKSGGRVMKNVTGYDMCKLLAGSFGTLAVMTKVTFKVLPAPEETRTVLIRGLEDGPAVEAMTRALRGPWEVSGAAHLTKPLAATSAVASVADADAAATALRLEGPAPSVAARAAALSEELSAFGGAQALHTEDSNALWREIGNVAPFRKDRERHVWRLSVPPSAAPGVVERISASLDALAFYDWGGGLIWLSLPATGDGAQVVESERIVRAAIAGAGGHATLIRADAETRRTVPVFEPQPGPLARLTARVKENFDPKGILNAGRMYAGV